MRITVRKPNPNYSAGEYLDRWPSARRVEITRETTDRACLEVTPRDRLEARLRDELHRDRIVVGEEGVPTSSWEAGRSVAERE